MNAIRRSFQTQRNWKIPNAASTGTESGMTTLRKIRRFEAPSTLAASIRSRGSAMKKFRIRKIPSGRPNAVCASQIPPKPLAIPSSRKRVSSGTSAICTGTIISATTTRKIVSRNGKEIHEKPYAASAATVNGRSVAGIVMIRLLTKAVSMLARFRTSV